MKYFKVIWEHDFEDEAVFWYHEIGDDGFETRKLLIFKDGGMAAASSNFETKDTYLTSVIFHQ